MDPNEKLTGIASMMPQGGAPMGGGAPAPMAPPPMPQSGMGGPPPMPMGGGEPPMDPMMGGEQPPMNVEQDAMMLAEAVVGRTQGDIGAAVDVLDTAKAMLMSSGNQEPQMMNMGGPLYAESGTAISNSDSDTLRQMIMDSLQTQEGRGLSDKDLEFYLKMLPMGSSLTSVGKSVLGALGEPKTQTGKRMMPPVSRAGGGTLMSGDYLSAEDAINSAMHFAKS